MQSMSVRTSSFAPKKLGRGSRSLLKAAVSFLSPLSIWALLTHVKSVVTDPEDPRFDLEKLIASLEAQS